MSRNRTKVKTLGVVVLAAGLLVGCGGGSDEAKNEAKAASDDDAIARAALLTVADFPAGWAETKDVEPRSALSIACEQEQDLFGARTGNASSGTFSPGANVPSITESISVYPTATDVIAVIAKLPAYYECVIDGLNKGEIDDNEFRYTNGSFSPLSFPQLSETTAAYRLQFTVDASDDGSSAVAVADFVSVQHGRFLILLTTLNAFDAFDIDQLVAIGTTAVAKVGTGTLPEPTSRAPAVAGTKAPTAAAARPVVGTITSKDGSKYTVNQVVDSPPPSSEYFKPAAGKRWYAVDVTQEGTDANGDEANQFYFAIQDSAGFVYTNAFVIGGPEPSFSSSDLAQGQVLRGWVTFEIPATATIISVLAQTTPLGGRTVIAHLQ